MFKKLLAPSLLLSLSINVALAQTPTFKDVYGQYNQAFASEDYESAVTYAKQTLELGKQIYGANSENAINLEYNLGLAYSANKQPELAYITLGNVANAYKELSGDNSVQRYSAILDQIATAENYTQMNFEKKVLKYRSTINSALNIVDNVPNSDIATKANMYYQLSRMLIKSPINSYHFKQAFSTLEKTESLLLAAVGEKDTRTVEVQFLLAKYNSAKRRTQKAIEYYETVVNVIEGEIETSHPYELASRAALVGLYEGSGDSKLATEHCIAIGHMTPWNDNIDPTPLYRMPPDYPMSKGRMGKDGSVVLSFDIDQAGFVKNINMLEQEGGQAFVTKAIKALEQWRYAPKIVDGQAVVAENMKVQLDFKVQS
ncbi:MAG: TonB family protein [Aliiglaciecola sp.]|uniref:TonB family protein n=1 Tax=Aliiglaciecola sp. TaxID=1872441 RepID=UPI003296AC46